MTQDEVPRRPDRDSDYAHYQTPVRGQARPARPDDGAPDGCPALAVTAKPGDEVRALPLEGQIGAAEVLQRGSLLGTTLALYVTAGQARRDYVVLIGNLGESVPLERGATVAPNAVIGHAGGKPVLWAVRLLRPGVEARSLSPRDLLGESSAVWVDPRNVLPRR